MKKEQIARLHDEFEQLVRRESEFDVEFWLARELQPLLGYSRWENFNRVIEKAREACDAAGCLSRDHFLEITKKVTLGSGAEREVQDFALT